MDNDKKIAAIADLQAACDRFAEKLRDKYNAMPEYSGATSIGLLGGTFKADANGKPRLSPWETTPLRTLTLHPDLAHDIALKYGVQDAEILELGAWNLPDSDNGNPFRGHGASTYFARLALSNGAASRQAFAGWLAELEAHGKESELVQSIETQYEQDRRTYMRSIQGLGTNATINKANALALTILERFKVERRLHRSLKLAAIFKNVATHLNSQGILTLQNNQHSGESVRKILTQYDLSDG